jgi:hypothetical protein
MLKLVGIISIRKGLGPSKARSKVDPILIMPVAKGIKTDD